MIVFGGRRGCGCGGCLTIVVLLFVVLTFLQMVRVPNQGPQPIHPVYPATATPTGGGRFSSGRLTVPIAAPRHVPVDIARPAY